MEHYYEEIDSINNQPATARRKRSRHATPAQESVKGDCRLLTQTAFAKEVGLSRTTIWRMIQNGKLLTVPTYRSGRRIPATEIERIMKGEPLQRYTHNTNY